MTQSFLTLILLRAQKLRSTEAVAAGMVDIKLVYKFAQKW
jgi:hypothetical protein